MPPGSEADSSPYGLYWELVDYFAQKAPISDDISFDPGPALEVLQSWLSRYGGTSAIARLPSLTYAAAGGGGATVLPVAAAWHVTRQAVKLFDDVEDGDVAQRLGEAVNTAAVLLFVAQSALELLSADPGTNKAPNIRRALNRAMLRAASGQQTDLIAAGDVGRIDPDGWLRVASEKSGELLGWAAWAGAMVAPVEEIAATHYHAYGFHLGVLLQVADDFNGIWGAGDRSDLRAGCLSLPVCYALQVASAEGRESLLTLLTDARRGDSRAEARARQGLVDLGAQAYCLAVAQVQYHAAIWALDHAEASDPGRQVLKDALDAVMPALTKLGRTERQRE